jgi:hypothetical protein
METVKIDKEKLLAKLVANRNAHRAIFLKAQEGYRKTVIRQLDKMLRLARRGKRIPLQVQVQVAAPVDQTEDYDRVISMMRWTKDKVIELTEGEFAQYVLDQWRWSAQAGVSNAYYSRVK